MNVPPRTNQRNKKFYFIQRTLIKLTQIFTGKTLIFMANGLDHCIVK